MSSRLAEFRINGLFGLYSHKIPLNLTDHITIIIGPNGRGKTVCLKFIEALFSQNYPYFADIPFETAEFVFAGGENITVTKLSDRPKTREAALRPPVQFSVTAPGKPSELFSPGIADLGPEIRRYLSPSWRRVSYDLWIDRTDGEELTTSELLARYPMPPKVAALLQPELPPTFAQLIQQVDCHLIETQRLLVIGTADDDEDFIPQYRRSRRHSQLAIQQKAQTLQSILRDTLTHYANLSQSLDRTFPLRVFEAQGSTKLHEDQLREALHQVDEKREALMSAGILDVDYQPVTLREGNIDPGVAMALEIYVTDANQKLDVFNDLRAKLDLFKQLIEARFIDKTLRIDRESGFKAISKTGAEVPLDKLSSGEQHQLILVFDLLFEVKRDSLILIDEPELSLHVAWQKSFIPSLQRIIALNSFDVLLATHSPAILAKRFNLAVELGPVDEEAS